MTDHATRPSRLRLKDFAARDLTLNSAPSAWRPLYGAANGEAIVCLGYGGALPPKEYFVKDDAELEKKSFYWLDAPEIVRQYQAAGLPLEDAHTGYTKISPLELSTLLTTASLFMHDASMRLAPDFWGPILAEIEVKSDFARQSLPPDFATALSRSVWLPGNTNQLLHNELYKAILENGYTHVYEQLPEKADLPSLLKIWRGQKPEIALSINFRGLDAEGRIFELCQGLDIPVAIWLVDNPFHLISGIKYPWWKRAKLFITDKSFVQPLGAYGARHVITCPLAAADHMWKAAAPQNSGAPIFVGRSEFPDKKKFFGTSQLSPELLKSGQEYFQQTGKYPDYHWWIRQYGKSLWPGLAGRLPGLASDTFSAMRRALWLEQALPYGLRIIGDDGWTKFFPAADLIPPVDYYLNLADLYNQASLVLNVTSLLLPASLNQRHFDVWASNGLLLTDKTEGLDIFPHELVEPIILPGPESFAEKKRYWQEHPVQRRELIAGWREHLLAAHLYKHRLNFIIDKIKKQA